MKHSDTSQNSSRSSRLTYDDASSSEGSAAQRRLTLSGRVIEPEITGLRQEGEKWLSTLSGGQCVVDLAAVETASSIFLSLLLCWRRQAHSQGLDIRFDDANERLQALAVMSQVDDQLPGLSTQ